MQKKKSMKNQIFSTNISNTFFSRSALLLLQFFFIIFIYHTLKDLKDTVVITASEAGAEVIPFIKIWGMLPASIGASYLFAKLYNRLGREKTLYAFVALLLGIYILFAFFLYPFREELYLSNVHEYLTLALPSGCKGFIAMVAFWHYTLFYLAAELWSPLILSILFWGYINETSTLDDAKKFYPLCMFAGNFAGIISGFASHWLCHDLREFLSWQQTIQIMMIIVTVGAFVIMSINRVLSNRDEQTSFKTFKKRNHATSFRENIKAIFQSTPLLCIAALVIGFGLTSNLIEVVWKESIRRLHPDPQAYNAYINQLTSIIGILAVCMALASRWIFQVLSWSNTALITPVTLFITSSIFFSALLMPTEHLEALSSLLSITPIFLIVTLGSIHYVLAMTAKYTIFDTCKEMAFLSIESEQRIKAKSVIDSIGSRLGKSGASCLYQFLLVVFGSAAGHLSIIGITSITVIGISILATKKLGTQLASDSLESKSLEPEAKIAQ